MPPNIANTLSEQVSVEAIGPDQFQAVCNPDRMGNTAGIAYGGCTLAVAVHAACQTVEPNYYPYSITRSYLGPALLEEKLVCSVRRLRDTRTSATRQIEVTQKQNGGTTRLCMIVLADFHKDGEQPFFKFSAPPGRSYSPPDKCSDPRETAQALAQQGLISKEESANYKKIFGLMFRFFDTVLPSEGIAGKNLFGAAKRIKTEQDSLPLTSKTSADWFRSKTHINDKADHYAGMAFVMDAYMAFLPLSHSGMFLEDAGPCSSLDFALRFFTNDIDINQWHLREVKAHVGDNARVYTEGRLWDQSGAMVANMTQQSILRPKPAPKPSF